MNITRISADSTCDLSKELLSQYNITTIPLSVVCGENSYKDGVDITPSDIFRMVDEENIICKTAAVNIFDYSELFKRLLCEADNVIHISISSEFSTCYQNACNAAEEFNGKVFVIDSRNLSTGSAFLALEGSRQSQKGIPANEIFDYLEEMKNRVDSSFIIDTLSYLKRGGRCSALQAFGAAVLKLKPCIIVKDGLMTVADTYRGSLSRCLRHYVKDRLKDDTIDTEAGIFITHSCSSREIICDVIDEINKHKHFSEIMETYAGCTVSCHCGPNTLGILYVHKK